MIFWELKTNVELTTSLFSQEAMRTKKATKSEARMSFILEIRQLNQGYVC